MQSIVYIYHLNNFLTIKINLIYFLLTDLSEPSQCTNPRGLGIRPGVQVQNNEAPVQNNPGTVNINVPPPRLATPRFNQDGQFIGYDHGLQFLPVATLPVQSNPRTVRINIPPPRGATPRFNQDGQLIGYDHGTQFLPVAFPPGSPPS